MALADDGGEKRARREPGYGHGRGALEGLDRRPQIVAVAAVAWAGVERARREGVLKPENVAVARQKVGVAECRRRRRRTPAIDAGVGDVVRLEPVHHLAVEQDDLRLHVGADIDADDLGAVGALDEQRRAR